MDWQAAIEDHKKHLSKYIWNDAALALAQNYRTKLTQAGFSEATWPAEGKNLGAKNPLRFYRFDTELTAFFVNLEPAGDSIRIFYGFGSTAFTRMKGNERVLLEMGLNESDNTLRFLCPASPDAAGQIAAVYHQYHGNDKDTLLALLKERRKEWIAKITAVLKPLGFRKKGNEWRKVFPSGHTLWFGADKSSYSDGYNFDVRLKASPGNIRPGDWCAFALWEQPQEQAIDPFCHHNFDWQLNTAEDLEAILKRFLTEYLEPLESQDTDALRTILRCGSKECPVPNCPLRCTL